MPAGTVDDPDARSRASVHIRDVALSFGRADGSSLRVLDGIDLQVEAGEFVCLVGPSGCGKTTLLRVLAGLLAPDEGVVEIDGSAVRGPRTDTSVVFQDSGLFPWKTVRRNVEAGIRLRDHRRLSPEQQQACRDTIARVGLAGFEDDYPAQLSGGMRQRVGLARALVRRPKVLLMDEPFGALDAQTRALMQEELQSLCSEEGSTVVFVTHDLDEAAYLADRIVLMSRNPGRIAETYDVLLPRPRQHGAPELAELRTRAWGRLRIELEETTP